MKKKVLVVSEEEEKTTKNGLSQNFSGVQGGKGFSIKGRKGEALIFFDPNSRDGSNLAFFSLTGPIPSWIVYLESIFPHCS